MLKKVIGNVSLTKEELIYITLKQLSDSLKTTPENFKLEDPPTNISHGSFLNPTIIWQFKVKIENNYIPDPLNSTKTIIVTYSSLSKQLSCYIYNREVNTLNSAVMCDTHAEVQYNDFIPCILYRTYRQFNNLKRSLIKRKNEKEFVDYLKKLGQIFPNTGDDELLK